ncbi:MAG: hypothetical protein OJF48_000228 [Afipia sp.]|nr:MAG: hypothetical protein OJF48_000228 [Afipia sp.]
MNRITRTYDAIGGTSIHAAMDVRLDVPALMPACACWRSCLRDRPSEQAEWHRSCDPPLGGQCTLRATVPDFPVP